MNTHLLELTPEQMKLAEAYANEHNNGSLVLWHKLSEAYKAALLQANSDDVAKDAERLKFISMNCALINHKGTAGKEEENLTSLREVIDLAMIAAAPKAYANSEWIKHDGGEMPVPGEALVEVRYRNGSETISMKANELDWEHQPKMLPSVDIVEYRLSKPTINEGVDKHE